MTSKSRRLFLRCRFFGSGGALIFAIWLAAAIASPAQTFNVLFSFDGTDGGNPGTSLVQGRDGAFYGVTGGWLGEGGGGAYGDGTVFKTTPTGELAVLHSFDGTDGTGPNGPLILATDGSFYGTTYWGASLRKRLITEVSGTFHSSRRTVMPALAGRDQSALASA